MEEIFTPLPVQVQMDFFDTSLKGRGGYFVQYSDDLEVTFTSFNSFMAEPGQFSAEVTDFTFGLPERFYRVMESP